MRKTLMLLSLILIWNCKSKKDMPIYISVSENWQFKGTDTLDWKSASVPGNVMTDLLDHKIIEDPFIQTNEEKAQWIATENWEYKTTFSLNDSILKKENIYLNFEGLDTYTTIFLNDSVIGQSNNAFKTFTFDIKKLLKEEN